MKYTEFESIISPERMRKYNVACGGNTAKAMTLYRYNLRLSQEMFVVGLLRSGSSKQNRCCYESPSW